VCVCVRVSVFVCSGAVMSTVELLFGIYMWCAYAWVCAYGVYVCVWVCANMCASVRAQVHSQVHACVRACMHVCMSACLRVVCVCVCMYERDRQRVRVCEREKARERVSRVSPSHNISALTPPCPALL